MAKTSQPRKDQNEPARTPEDDELPDLHEAGGVSREELDRWGEAGPERDRKRHDRTRDRELDSDAV